MAAPWKDAVVESAEAAPCGPEEGRADWWQEVVRFPAAAGGEDRVPTGRAPVVLARGVLVLVLAGIAVAVSVGVLASAAPASARAVGAAAVLAQLVVQLRLSLGASGPPSPRTAAAGLLLQTGLAVLTTAAVGAAWPGLSGFVVGGLLLSACLRVALPASVAVVAAVLLVDAVRGPPPDLRRLLVVAVVSGVLGLVVAGTTRLVQVVTGLLVARAEEAVRATERERVRVARDVHDLLGLGLSAITLKCDLALRLLPSDAGTSRTQLAEVLVLARRTLADVRSVAHGVESLSLDEEITLAQDVLMTVDVRVRVEVDRPVPVGPVGAVLAAAMREGVTNVLRHSDATQCAIVLLRDAERVSLEIVNDGLRPVASARPAGQGLRNLRERASGMGGAVSVGRRGRTHVLRVVLPAEPFSARRITTSPPHARSGWRPRGSARRAS